MCLSIEVDKPECVLAKGEHLGHEWVVVHNLSGYRCGYVRVAKGHPWHGVDYHKIAADVHGGLTFAEPDKPCGKGEADDAYWVGFDCAHYNDLPDPELPEPPPERRWPSPWEDTGTIRTQQFVEAECRLLCEQAAAAT